MHLLAEVYTVGALC